MARQSRAFQLANQQAQASQAQLLGGARQQQGGILKQVGAAAFAGTPFEPFFGPSMADMLQGRLDERRAIADQDFAIGQEQADILEDQRVRDQLPGVGAAVRQLGVPDAPGAHNNIALAQEAERMLRAGMDPDMVAQRLGMNPENNPIQAGILAREAYDRQRTLNLERSGNRAVFTALGQEIGAIQDMRTLYDEVGSETLPTAEKGAFDALRFRTLNTLRKLTESGALQQAEIELFNSLIPEGDEWTSLGRAEKYARLNQLEYWLKQNLENQIMATGMDSEFSVADFDTYGREFDAILGEVPPGSVPGGFGSGNMGQVPQYGGDPRYSGFIGGNPVMNYLQNK